MTRRCQVCARLFPGDVCPGCGESYGAVTPPDLIPHFGQPRGGGVPPGTARRDTCADCATPLPKVHAPIQRCATCRAKRERRQKAERKQVARRMERP